MCQLRGVDLNTASAALLSYVAGISKNVAKNIVAFREENGAFKARKELRSVPGIGPKTFQQAAGFLRIRSFEDPLPLHLFTLSPTMWLKRSLCASGFRLRTFSLPRESNPAAA